MSTDSRHFCRPLGWISVVFSSHIPHFKWKPTHLAGLTSTDQLINSISLDGAAVSIALSWNPPPSPPLDTDSLRSLDKQRNLFITNQFFISVSFEVIFPEGVVLEGATPPLLRPHRAVEQLRPHP